MGQRLELWAVVSHPTWVLGLELRSSTRGTSQALLFAFESGSHVT